MIALAAIAVLDIFLFLVVGAWTVGMRAPVDMLENLIRRLGIGNDDHVVLVPVSDKALDVRQER